MLSWLASSAFGAFFKAAFSAFNDWLKHKQAIEQAKRTGQLEGIAATHERDMQAEREASERKAKADAEALARADARVTDERLRKHDF